MVSVTPNKALFQPDTGEDVNTWGPVINQNFTAIDSGLAGAAYITLASAGVSLTDSQFGNSVLVLSGTLLNDVGVTLPAKRSSFTVFNNTTGNFRVVFGTTTTGGTQLILPKGVNQIYSDGGNVLLIGSSFRPYFRFYSPNCAIPFSAVTIVSNYGGYESATIDSNVDPVGGGVQFGTNDAGVWQFNATCSTMGPNEAISVFIFVNNTAVASSTFAAADATIPAATGCSIVLRVNLQDIVSMRFQQTNVSQNPDNTQVTVVNQFSGVRIGK